MIIDRYVLVQTCKESPEQYTVYKDGEQVAYIRLPFYQLLKEFKYPNPSLVELNELKPIKKIGAK